MNWKKEIDELFKLASLHSWCSQVNDLIVEFNNKHKKNNLIVAYLVSKLKEKNLPGEYYILSLVLLNYQDYPTKDIIELAISSLYGKLNKNDILFFKDHLFSGNFPLSSRLSEDITNRSFLSSKVAIKKAMEIDSVISKNNPIITVLYMNFILSRVDMNEENRAMVAFLLLRLDVELPKSLNERVFKYLVEYKDIIQELLQEENGETIIIDDIYSINENIKKIQIIQKENILEKGNIPESNSVSDQEIISENIKPENLKLHKITGSGISILEYSTIKTKTNHENTTLYKEEKKSPKIDISYLSDNIQIKDKSNLNKMLLLKKDKIHKVKNLKGDIEEKIRSKKTKNQSKEVIDIRKQTKSDKKELSSVITNLKRNKTNIFDKSKKSKFVNKTDIAKKSWIIGLKKNKRILESILVGVEKNKTSMIVSITKNINLGRKISVFNKRLLKKYISAGIVIILFITIAGLKYTKSVARDSKDLSLNIINDGLIQDKNLLESESLDNGIEFVIPETDETKKELDIIYQEDIKNIIPKDFPLNISIKNNKIIWVVKEGESITDLFLALQGNRQNFKNTALEKISNITWEKFFTIFKNNNPVRDSYHIIYPAEIFELPIY